MSPKIDIDPEHAEAIAATVSLADKIRYACERVDPPTTHAVQQWLAAYGVNGVTRAYATGIINTWRGENRMGDTGDLVAMSPELLAELDALRSSADAATAADDSPTVVGLTPVGADQPQPQGDSPIPSPDSDTVDTDRDSAADTATIALPADSTPDTPAPRTDAESAAAPTNTAPVAAAPTNTAAADTAKIDAVKIVSADVDSADDSAKADPAAVDGARVDSAPDTDDDAGGERPRESTALVAGNAVVVAEQAPVDGYVTARAERMDNPLMEPAAPLTPKVPTVLSWSANMAWIVVLVAAMGISWWSLFEYARGFSIPTPLAAVVSLVFDASALIVAGLAHRYALSPYSGAGPRFALLALLAGSVYLNWEHAAGKGYGIEASIMFAAPAAVGILLFELHIGWHSRSERRARGRVARSLPVIGAWGWFLHPMQSLTTLWRVTHARGVSVRESELNSIESLRAISAPQ
ncbi:DUF2637 domain-containing protein [Actinokineospora diospyrosa]|uniref:DUF2637 domain-containing protein n=1 Tax=Actinokineospora diospyrosa TaxID=103728 RepID=A0ABT1I8Z2_9PSEU|nr:DUF2637 domain-containing protein [Actinokineospora diospyrosa]MCP2269043.1 Protein of unknown function (DUF2637) [Actinokineospora diospyrosa]